MVSFTPQNEETRGAVSLSGVTSQWDGVARLSRRNFLHFLTL